MVPDKILSLQESPLAQNSKFRVRFSLDESDNSTFLQERDLLMKRTNAFWDLAFISQPPNEPRSSDYIYESPGGTGSTIYIIDSGANPAHIVSRSFIFLSDFLSILTQF